MMDAIVQCLVLFRYECPAWLFFAAGCADKPNFFMLTDRVIGGDGKVGYVGVVGSCTEDGMTARIRNAVKTFAAANSQ